MEWNAGSVKRNPPETVTGLQELMQIYLPKKNYFNTLRRPWPVSSYFVFFDNESWWQLLIFQDWWSFPNSLPTSNFGRKYFSGKLYWRTIYNQLNHPSCILKDNAIQYWRAITYIYYHLFLVSSVLSEDVFGVPLRKSWEWVSFTFERIEPYLLLATPAGIILWKPGVIVIVTQFTINSIINHVFTIQYWQTITYISYHLFLCHLFYLRITLVCLCARIGNLLLFIFGDDI